jgi:AraC-like DNA-binding protein
MMDMSPGAAFHANYAQARGRGAALRRSDYFEILAVQAGRGWHVLSTTTRRGEREDLLPGQMFALRPSDVHEFGSEDPDGVSLVYVDFSVSSWHELTAVSDLDEAWSSASEVPRATVAIPEGLRPFHDAVVAVRRGPTPFDMMRFWADVVPVFVAADRDRQRRGLPSWLSASLDAMREESNLRGGVARLLSLSHVSAAHLSRSMRQHLGVTPTELVTELQLRHAATLLTTTRESVGIIAARCGFANPNYLSTRFRALYAIPPTEYRRRAFG